MLYINPKAIEGKKFTVNDPTIEYLCIGYAQNSTELIVGSYFDSVNNRSEIHTFKIKEIKFKGEITLS